MKKVLLTLPLILLLLSVSFSGNAQTNDQNQQISKPPPYPSDVLFNNIAKNNYLAAFMKLKELELQYKGQPMFLYDFSYINSYIGNYQQAYSYYDKISPLKETKDLQSSPVDSYTPLNAVEAIASIAEKEQVIMINEEHDTPMHRAFTTLLLPVLYGKGFRYFAAETLSDYDPDLNRRGYPTNLVARKTEKGLALHGTGFYTADPVFGDLIRTALKLGFKVVPYEHRRNQPCKPTAEEPMLCQNKREQGQAQNLYDRILRQDPKAKILVHVGRGHNAEGKQNNGWMPMGAYFKEITKIDPFTINQMTMSERSKPEYEHPLYRYVIKKWSLKEPAIFRSNQSAFFSIGSNDLLVFHPRAVYESGRPDWLKVGGWRKPHNININTINRGKKIEVSQENPVLVQAFLMGENEEAVPIDQVLISNWNATAKLLLPKGTYHIRAIKESGEEVGQYEFSLR